MENVPESGRLIEQMSGRQLYCDTYYAVQRWDLRCRCDFSDHSAMCFMYRYVICLRARFQTIGAKLLKSAPQRPKILWNF